MQTKAGGNRSSFQAKNALGYQLARGLGYFSIALGALEMVAPGGVNRALGMRPHNRLVRGFGLREIGAGAGILTQPDPTPYVWARVAGDAMDMLALLAAAGDRNRRRGSAVAALLAVVGVTALDVFCARELSAVKQRSQRVRDYSNRSGFRRPAAEMRGSAVKERQEHQTQAGGFASHAAAASAPRPGAM
jgi:hypothetical protein